MPSLRRVLGQLFEGNDTFAEEASSGTGRVGMGDGRLSKKSQ
jgi:hypothetical protein